MPMSRDSMVADPMLPAAGALLPPRPAAAPDPTARPIQVWGYAGLLSVIALGTSAMLATAPLVVIVPTILVVAIGIAWAMGRTDASPLVIGLVPTTLLANSGLVPAATYYVAPATLGLSIVFWTARWSAQHRQLPPLPPRAFVGFAGLYLAAVAVATIFSIRLSTSIPYVAAIAILVPVSLWLGPWLLSRSGNVGNLLRFVALTGVATALISIVLALSGPLLWFGRWIGAYLVHELTLSGQPTGIVFLRTAGPYLAPASEALVLAPAILAALALRSSLSRRRRLLVSAAVALMVLALVSTFARVGWGAVIAGSAVLALAPIRSRRIDLGSALVCGVLLVAFVALWFNAIGTDYRPDLTEARATVAAGMGAGDAGGDALPVVPVPEGVGPGSTGGDTPRFVARGGSELSGRLELWSASVGAIANSPWIGYGPGSNAIALDPYLTGDSRRFVGLSSHNTWLRTWMEDGVVGLIGLIGIALTALYVAIRRMVADRNASWQELGLLAIFVGLGVAQAFETFLLGGVSFPSFGWAIAAGLLVIDPAVGSSTRLSERDA